MKPKDWFLWVAEVILWFAFVYYALYSIKNPVNLFESALILLVLAYLASIACPLVRNSDAWRKTWQKEK